MVYWNILGNIIPPEKIKKRGRLWYASPTLVPSWLLKVPHWDPIFDQIPPSQRWGSFQKKGVNKKGGPIFDNLRNCKGYFFFEHPPAKGLIYGRSWKVFCCPHELGVFSSKFRATKTCCSHLSAKTTTI